MIRDSAYRMTGPIDRPISAAADCSTGRSSRSIVAGVKRAAWTPTLTAATTRSPARRTGTAIERRPSSSSSSTIAKPRARTRSILGSERALLDDRPRRVALGHEARKIPGQLVAGQGAEEHAPHRRAVGGKTARHGQPNGQDPLRGGARDVDDVVAVEDGEGAGLVQPVGHAFEDGLRDARRGRRREIRVAQRQHARPELVGAARGGRIPEHRQRVQTPPGRRARDPDFPGHLGDRERPAAGAERADHRQATLEREHVVRIGPGRTRGRGRRRTGTAPGWRAGADVFERRAGARPARVCCLIRFRCRT